MTNTVERQPQAFLEDLIPADSIYWRIVETEREIDHKILSKQLKLTDAHPPSVMSQVPKFMTVSVNSALVDYGQGQRGWWLRVEGRPLDGKGRKFSSILKRLLVELPATGELFEWTKPANGGHEDGFEIKRLLNNASAGEPDSMIPVRVTLQLDSRPEQYRLTPALSRLCGHRQRASRGQALLSVLNWIKQHRLQESEEKRRILCDEALQALFGKEQLEYDELARLLPLHLLPLEPIVIEHTIELIPEIEHGQTTPLQEPAYRILATHRTQRDLEIDDAAGTIPDAELRPRLPNTQLLGQLQKEMGAWEQRIQEFSQALRTSVATQRLLEAFVADPARELCRLIQEQSRDMGMLTGERRLAAYEGEFVERAVSLILSAPKPH